MKICPIIFVIALVVVRSITANVECPADPSKVEPGRKCKKKCSSDKECKGSNRGCHCDNFCGMSCINKGGICKPPPPFENGRIIGGDYVHGSILEYVCDEGYILKGTSERRCNGDKKWGGKEPICELGCSAPPRKLNAFADIDGDGFAVKTKVIYKCHYGYNLMGKSEIECLDDFTWSKRNFECAKVNCGDPGSPVNGYIEGKDFFFGSTITYHCDKGYVIDDSEKVRRNCFATGKWSGEARTCTKITCPPPENPENGLVDITSATFEFRTLVSYHCDPGYHLVGNAKGQCNEDGNWGAIPTCSVDVDCNFDGHSLCGYTNEGKGKWERQFLEENTLSGNPTYVLRATSTPAVLRSPVIPTLQPYCFKFHYYVRSLSDDNGFAITSMNGQKTVGKVWVKEKRRRWLNQQITIEPVMIFGGIQYDITQKGEGTNIDLDDFSLSEGACRTNCGYKTCLNGGTCVDRVGTYTCLCTRFYKGKNCQIEITCPGLQKLYFGAIEVTPDPKKYKIDTVVRFSCQKGYRLVGAAKTITCLSGGRWSSRKRPMCEEILCENVKKPIGGSVVIEAHDLSKMSIGSVAFFYCPIGKYLQGSPSAIVCMPGGKWSDESRRTCVGRKIYTTECPPGYRKKNNVCYKEYKKSSFNQAVSTCASSGAFLSVIRSEEARKRLSEIVTTGKLYHLGLTDSGREYLLWSNGGRFQKTSSETYSGNFKPRNDVTSEPRCGAFVQVNQDSEITASPCDVHKSYICETFPSSIKPVQLFTNDQTLNSVIGVYRPMLGLSYSGSFIYRNEETKDLYLFRQKSGWTVGPFDLVKTQPTKEKAVIKTITQSELPQDITDGWQFGPVFSEKEGQPTDVTIEIYDLWKSWSSWSPCTKNCGGGSKLRTRDCGQPGGSPGFGDCKGKFIQNIQCNTRQCIITRWGVWGDWSECSKPCDGGVRKRRRNCTKDPLSSKTCSGIGEQTEPCNEQKCLPDTSIWTRLDIMEYKIVSGSLSIADATRHCRTKNGQIATVQRQAEWTFLKRKITRVHCASKSAWLDWKLWARNERKIGGKHALVKRGNDDSTKMCDLINHSCESKNFTWGENDCDGGISGFICEREWKPCNSNPCNDGGECTNMGDDFVCKCFENFQGKNCETEIRCNIDDLMEMYKVSYASTKERVIASYVGKNTQIQLDCMNSEQATTDRKLFTCIGLNLWNTKGKPHIDCVNTCLLPELGKDIIAKHEDVLVKSGDSFPLETLLIFECPQSMELVGDPTSVCEEGGWDILPVKCESALPCSPVEPPAFGELEVIPKYQKGLLKSGTTITLRCDKNHAVTGVSKITCGKDGRWTNELGLCTDKVGCSLNVDKLPAGVTAMTFPSFVVITKNRVFQTNEFAYLLCQKDNKSTFKEISCLENGIWDTTISTFCT